MTYHVLVELISNLLVFIDLPKAFDTVYHDIFLRELPFKQKKCIQNAVTISDLEKVFRVPQGAILSQDYFIL